MQTIPFSENGEAELFSASRPNSQWDDLSRNVYCVLGIPIDSIDLPTAIRAVEGAVANDMPFLISTPNLNYLVNSQLDRDFRETLLSSELCPADGMTIVWIATLIGLPIKARVAGSDLFEALKVARHSGRQLTLFLFGGAEGVVEAAARSLNESRGGLRCVGSICPGFGSIEEMSHDDIIDKINASRAEFLLVALGAKKGQLWLTRNHERLQIPVRAHLGATINFLAGNIRRAPFVMRKFGLEWLWRIKEEPPLWRRYWNDGIVLLRLLFTRVFPLAIQSRWQRLQRRVPKDLFIERVQDRSAVTLNLSGAAITRNVEKAASVFREAVSTNKSICINLSNTCLIDARFLGLLLMLRKRTRMQGREVQFTGASSQLRKTCRLNGAEFLLGSDGVGD